MKQLIERWLKRSISLAVASTDEINNANGFYSWNSIDAKFTFDTAKHVIQGYYMLEMTITKSNSNMLGAFYINENIASQVMYNLPVKQNGCFKRICYFPEKLESLTWSAGNVSGSLEGIDVVLKKVSKGFAVSRMKKKLKLKGFKGGIDKLLLAYESFFQIFNAIKEQSLVSDLLGDDSFFYLSEQDSSCVFTSTQNLSKEEKIWTETNKATAFVRSQSGLIKRLDK